MKTTSTTTISQAVADTAARLMKHGRFNAPDVVSLVRVNYPVLVAQQERHLADQAILRQAKLWLAASSRPDDEEGPVRSLPGMGLPRAIAVPDDEGYYYIAAELATWGPKSSPGLEERQVNKIRAEAALHAYEAEVERVRPLMESDPTLTYGEACERLGVDA